MLKFPSCACILPCREGEEGGVTPKHDSTPAEAALLCGDSNAHCRGLPKTRLHGRVGGMGAHGTCANGCVCGPVLLILHQATSG